MITQRSIVVILVSVTSITSCSVSDNSGTRPTFKPAKQAFISGSVARNPDTKTDKWVDKNHKEDETTCDDRDDCRQLTRKKVSLVASEKVVEPIKQTSLETNDSSSESLPEAGIRAGNTVTQASINANNDLDLVQLPNEENYQAVNSIWTSDLPHDSIVSQSAEYRNVIFNQLNSPGALHTINSTRHDDNSKNGNLNQSFKFKSIEMIQRNVGDGIHSMNYIGE